MTEDATTTEAPPGPRLDPGALLTLEEERDFLLRSLEDLEREHAVGDVDATDYAALKDDYTARAAAVLRSLEQRRTAKAIAAPRRSRGRMLAWIGLIVVVAGLAGVLIAHASGTRGAGDSATGDPLLDTRQLLSDAQTAAAGGDYAKSIDLYGKALDKQPGNVEALTYRGWSKLRAGDAAGAATDIDAAIDLDPKYPDARVFRAVVYVTAGKFDDAHAQLGVFDTLDAPPLMGQIIESQQLRERVALGRVEPKLLVTNAPSYVSAGFTADDLFLAAQQLDAAGRAKDELTLYAQMLAVNPKDERALAYEGWTLARTGVSEKQPALVTKAIELFGQALATKPAYADALVFRSFTYQFGLTRSADAAVDLAAFDALADKPAALATLIDNYGLRAAITTSLGTK
jgi:tetratricopeptide (TPR) repeat protein